MENTLRIFILEALLLLGIALHLPAGNATIEKSGPSWRISVDGRAFATIEAAKTVHRERSKPPDPRVRYAFVQGEKLGTIELISAAGDFRGTPIHRGTYVLTYQRQPPLKEHVDTSEFRDFLVLNRLDAPPASGHPLVLALVPASGSAAEPATVRLSDSGVVAELTVDGERVAVVLPGSQRQAAE